MSAYVHGPEVCGRAQHAILVGGAVLRHRTSYTHTTCSRGASAHSPCLSILHCGLFAGAPNPKFTAVVLGTADHPMQEVKCATGRALHLSHTEEASSGCVCMHNHAHALLALSHLYPWRVTQMGPVARRCPACAHCMDHCIVPAKVLWTRVHHTCIPDTHTVLTVFQRGGDSKLPPSRVIIPFLQLL
jgi:hypothetical protein